MSTFNITVLPGDGIGPEVAAAGVAALKTIGEVYGHTFNFEEKRIGGIAIDTDENPYPEDTDKACLAADAVLLGAVGGPKWDLGRMRPEQGLLAVRKSMGLFANLRPMSVTPSQVHRSPLKREVVEGKPRSRNVVIEFPSYQAALDCWNSPEYKAAAAIRAPITTADVVVIEGYEGMQP